MNETRPILQKLMSRKLLVALLAIFATLQDSHLGPLHAVVLGVVASAYIVAEAFIDRADRGQVFGELVGGITDGAKLGAKLGGDDDEPPAGTPARPLPEPPPPSEQKSPPATLRRAMVLALAVTALLVFGCRPSAPARPACSPETLAAIETAYVAEAVTTCRGRSTATCSELPAIEAKYRAKREEWVQCR